MVSDSTAGDGLGVGVGLGVGCSDGEGVGLGDGLGEGVGVGLGVGITTLGLGVGTNTGFGVGTTGATMTGSLFTSSAAELPPHMTMPAYEQLEPRQPSLQITFPFACAPAAQLTPS